MEHIFQNADFSLPG